MSISDNPAAPDNTTGSDNNVGSGNAPGSDNSVEPDSPGGSTNAADEVTTAVQDSAAGTVGTKNAAGADSPTSADDATGTDSATSAEEPTASDSAVHAEGAPGADDKSGPENTAGSAEPSVADKTESSDAATGADAASSTGEPGASDEVAGASEATDTDTATEPDKAAESSKATVPDKPAAPTPGSIPKPGPVPSPAALAKRPKAPAPASAPGAPAVVPPAAPTTPGASKWGRVDEQGVVSVQEGDEWRVVGEYPDGSHDEALQYYVRKFDELAFKVQAIEQRHQAGGASASALRNQASQLKKDVVGAAAVGDLAALESRLTTMIDELAEASAQEAAAQREAVDAAIAERTAIVEQVEVLAARDPKSVQWKQATAELNDLFDSWQNHQKTGPRLPKSTAQGLWKRFRDARSKIERARRAFFAELDEVHKAAKVEKTRIVERAEALAPRGEDGIPTYRDLLDEWKRSGRAGRKADDALWARFKAAGDVLYGARADRNAEEQAESKPRIEEREALLEEAKKVADITDLKNARQTLTDIQRRWEAVGRIFPRDVERDLDGRMRKIELALKGREDVDWKRNNPETKARVGDMDAQLRESIQGLEKELSSAKAAGDDKAVKEAQEALDARTSWLRAIGG